MDFVVAVRAVLPFLLSRSLAAERPWRASPSILRQGAATPRQIDDVAHKHRTWYPPVTFELTWKAICSWSSIDKTNVFVLTHIHCLSHLREVQTAMCASSLSIEGRVVFTFNTLRFPYFSFPSDQSSHTYLTSHAQSDR